LFSLEFLLIRYSGGSPPFCPCWTTAEVRLKSINGGNRPTFL
jgi:hypothetical protein